MTEKYRGWINDVSVHKVAKWHKLHIRKTWQLALILVVDESQLRNNTLMIMNKRSIFTQRERELVAADDYIVQVQYELYKRYH